MAFELGIYHFGELSPDPVTHRPPAPGVRLRELIEQAKVADEVGLDIFAVGEHHRGDFAVSAPLSCWRPWPPAPAISSCRAL